MSGPFDSRFLRDVLILVREAAPRRAAGRLNIAPSALSRKERRLGVALLERSRHASRG